MLKITKLPWINDLTGIRSEHHAWYIIDADDVNNEDREAIVSAINQTYGNGINPQSIPDYVKLLAMVTAYYWSHLSEEHKDFVRNLIEQSKL